MLAYVDIVALLRNLVGSVKPYAARRGLDMTFMCRPGGRVVRTDAEFVERIVINLLPNAIKHTPEGGKVHVKYEDDRESLLISVEDNGEGIPDEKKRIIFDRFRQVDNTLSRTSEGCGIGLSITKSLVELLDGRIWVESEMERGSTFFVEMPKRRQVEAVQSISVLPANLQSRIMTELSDINF
jgi:signal transduction histidine kinase